MSKQIDILIYQCKKGNRKAQMHIYDKYCNAMFTVACRYLPDEEAKDAMQEGFLKAFLNIQTFKKDKTFGAWLKRIIINQCIDQLKKKKIKTSFIEEVQLEIVDDEDWLFDTQITKQEILQAIDQLSEKYQLVVKLYLLEGYDHSEISQILGIEVKTSRTQLRRGKLQLRELLKKHFNEARH
ncbi:RNA polymerase sigma factor [uncultured Tenacibaculum sp.]|uniref:RNA polymerase sigma factor n=1 Tax=uncultured Tenacibaculum sp. TaxID=174713 RepID=UPI002628B8EE|nr:sigma-70 family RNA polymerase sigma factor [uncultured Tenacibaculum sp.]